MRVVHASFHRDRTGRSPAELLRAWPTLTDVARAVQSAGVDIQVVQAHTERHVCNDGPTVVFTNDVLAELARLQPDVVHVHGLRFARETRAITERLPRTIVVAQDHGGGAPARWARPIIRWGLGRVRGALFTAAEQSRAYGFALPRTVRVFEVLESSTHFAPTDQALAKQVTGITGDPCLLWVGRLDANKDPLTALQAVRIAAERLPGLKLWCCFTASPLRSQVERVIHSDEILRSRVHLLGRVDHAQVELLCSAADFFLAASHAEGSGYALLEAIACGATPIVTDIPSFRAILRDGAGGRLVGPGDSAAMARAIIELAEQPRAALRTQARRHFEQHLSFDVLGRDLKRTYEAVRS